MVTVLVNVVVTYNMIDWILASSSARRKELLASLGIPFKCVNANIKEINMATSPHPEAIAQANAKRKAQYVANLHPKSYVIGADTIVILDKKIFYKPHTFNEAKQMLQQLSNKEHSVVTAVSVICKVKNFHKEFLEESFVYFKPLTDDFIETYLKSINPLDKSGAYAIQAPLTQTFAKVSGSESNIVGFPIEKFKEIFL